MAFKSIVDIDVNDSQFKRFYEEFKKYDDRVKSMPKDWQKANAGFTTHLRVAAGHVHEMRSSFSEMERTHQRVGRTAEKISRTFSSTASHIGKITQGMLHLLGLGGRIAAAGIGLGAAGVYGMDRLARSTVNNAVAARGIGVSPGVLRASNQNLQGIAPNNFLTTLVGARRSLANNANFAQIGIDPMAAQRMSPQALQAAVLQSGNRFAAKYGKDPSTFFEQNPTVQAYGALGLNMSALSNLGANSASLIQRRLANVSKDSSRVGISDGSVLAMEKFVRRIDLAGNMLESALISKLAKLAPELGSLLDTLSTSSIKLIGQLLTPKNLQGAVDGMKHFAEFLESPQLETDMKMFGTGLHDLAVLLGWAVSGGKKVAGAVSSASSTIGNSDILNTISNVGYSSGLGRARALALFGTESGYSKNNIAQFTPATAKALGIDPNNVHQSIQAGEALLKGDIDRAKAIAPGASNLTHTLLGYSLYNGNNSVSIKAWKHSGGDTVKWYNSLPATAQVALRHYLISLSNVTNLSPFASNETIMNAGRSRKLTSPMHYGMDAPGVDSAMSTQILRGTLTALHNIERNTSKNKLTVVTTTPTAARVTTQASAGAN